MKNTYRILMVFLLLLSACAHPISKEFRNQVDPAVSLNQILQSPNQYLGKKVVLGGTIVETRNLKNVTEIEVVEKYLNSSGYPKFGYESRGRFVFRKKGYLESETFAKGRILTGGGTLVATKPGKIEHTEYEFPVIEVEELKLWDTPVQSYWFPPYAYGPYLAGTNVYYYPFYSRRLFWRNYYPYPHN